MEPFWATSKNKQTNKKAEGGREFIQRTSIREGMF
jgi:hypothetical protein